MCFFFNDTATTEIYTLSLHDALPIWGTTHHGQRDGDRRPMGRRGQGQSCRLPVQPGRRGGALPGRPQRRPHPDRKSTRLNSSHANISYAVFCLKKKQKYTLTI